MVRTMYPMMNENAVYQLTRVIFTARYLPHHELKHVIKSYCSQSSPDELSQKKWSVTPFVALQTKAQFPTHATQRTQLTQHRC